MAKLTFLYDTVIEHTTDGETLLHIALQNNVPLAHACGGNARCSTCRVIVLDGLETLDPRNPSEEKIAKAKGLEPNIRLACQIQPKSDLTIRRLVFDQEDMDVVLLEKNITTGREMDLTILFVNLRGFTAFAEKQLPYDVVHILNRYFKKMGDLVLSHSGHLDKFMGDGIMALFGTNGESPQESCRNATRASLRILEELNVFNAYMQKNFETHFQIGLGLHFGQVIVGEMGHPDHHQFTAVGDKVNLASRVESTTKKAGVSFLVSSEVYQQLREELLIGKKFKTSLKGKTGEYKLYEVVGLNFGNTDSPEAEIKSVIGKHLLEIIPIHLAPDFLRLAIHDALNFDATTNSGGANGSVRLENEVNQSINRGLFPIIKQLEELQNKLNAKNISVSFADLVAFGGAVAVSICGGPKIPLSLGRKDATESNGVDHIPKETSSDANECIEKFEKMGLNKKEMVALLGFHTLGKSPSAPYTDDPYTFNNSYYKVLLNAKYGDRRGLMNLDLSLLTHPELRCFVEDYALHQETFFQDFAIAYEKLTRVR